MKKDDHSIVGKRFGNLTVLSYDHTDTGYQSYWLCRCDCGNETVVRLSNLKSGSTKSCGCGRHKCRYEDLTGKRYGRLTVLGLDHIDNRGDTRWRCQ